MESGQKWVLKASFFEWYVRQDHYRLPVDRERDKAAEDASLSFPEMGRLLGIDRDSVYPLVQRHADQLTVITIAGRKRITKESFEIWYRSQHRYVKVTERAPSSAKSHSETQKHEIRRLNAVQEILASVKSVYTIQEASQLLQINAYELYRMIERNELTAKKIASKWRITGSSIRQWLEHLENDEREDGDNGIHCEA